MIDKTKVLVNVLKTMESYVEFCPDMLPNDISLSRILNALRFLSPTIIILHGSTVSRRKFSAKKNSDLDIVCVTVKAAFWSLEQLQTRIRENLGNEGVEIDLSIVSYNRFLSIAKGKSSLGKSLSHGFSISYYEEKQ
jgi:hypothetical protein